MKTPRNETELIILFAEQSKQYDIEIMSFDGSCPDAMVKWKSELYRVEFEYNSASFWSHEHNPFDCDVIVCWESTEQYPVLPIVTLSNPNWMNTEITLVRPVEKSASYWKKKALEIHGEEYLSTPPKRELKVELYQDEIRELYNQGKTLSYIARIILGGDGGNQIKAIKTLLNI